MTSAAAAAGADADLVRFTPDARIADITALLDNYQASIVDGKGGMFRLQFRAMDKDSVASLIARLQREKIVSLRRSKRRSQQPTGRRRVDVAGNDARPAVATDNPSQPALTPARQ